jgi:hypothetical protein
MNNHIVEGSTEKEHSVLGNHGTILTVIQNDASGFDKYFSIVKSRKDPYV